MTTVDQFLSNVQKKREACQHELFSAKVEVSRLTDNDGKVTGYVAEIKIVCDDCGHPFTWKGVPFGYSKQHPALSADGHELRAPIEPSNYDLERELKSDH